MKAQAPATGGVRFAPSPTGRFHVGNLRTAWISHQISRDLNLPWVVRFEDIDKPRVLPGAQEQQLKDLMLLGLKPDHVLVQSEFFDRHFDLFVRAVRLGRIYPCDCSRKEVQQSLASMASAPHFLEPVYSGRCRKECEKKDRVLAPSESLAWRFKMPNEEGHDDFIVARTKSISNLSFDQDFETSIRASFTPSYHWACAIDDHDGRYDWIVRSSDLEHAYHVQGVVHDFIRDIENARWPSLAPFHTSLVVQEDGHRLEKRTKGVTLDELLQSGETVASIIEKFRKSFTTKPGPGVWSENKKQIKLRELGFK